MTNPGEFEEAGRHIDVETVEEAVKETSIDAGAFLALRGLSNAIWLGGAAAGIALQEQLGISALITTPVIAGMATASEFAASHVATKLFKSEQVFDAEVTEDPTIQSPRLRTRVGKELFVDGYAIWNGAGSGVKVNESLGIRSTRTRRLAQSALYGAGVSLWQTHIPIVQQGRELVSEGINQLQNNTAETLAVGAVGSLAVYGVLRGVQWFRGRMRKNRSTKANEQADNIEIATD